VRWIRAIVCSTLAGSLGLLALTGAGGAAQAPAEDRLSLAVVALDARIGQVRARSSGTVVDAEDGLVLTSAHSVWGATSLKVATALGVLHGRVVARAPCDDLALVETQPRLPGLASLEASGAAPRPGALLSVTGRRRIDPDTGGLLTIPARAALQVPGLRIDPRFRPMAGAVPLDAALVPEASGGPIVDGEGRVVAMAAVTDPRQAGAGVPWGTVRERLDELRLGPQRLYVGWRDQYRCAGRLHAYASAAYPGYRRRDARLNAPVPATRLPGTEELDG